ncbi:WD40 repeat domain-containing protein [Lentzea nigeriaca]|uniref:WD40 repeat domain-containing protein n=1 Tax=Lentzea nigeriaca TaxID=1128665 RepID=UPI00195E231E|nr:WD40 repeat domain-containing protein [Lentzea nigeriaca]MBM7864273.1 WD40 repeat protein [Lentzea nigeriaca]
MTEADSAILEVEELLQQEISTETVMSRGAQLVDANHRYLAVVKELVKAGDKAGLTKLVHGDLAAHRVLEAYGSHSRVPTLTGDPYSQHDGILVHSGRALAALGLVLVDVEEASSHLEVFRRWLNQSGMHVPSGVVHEVNKDIPSDRREVLERLAVAGELDPLVLAWLLELAGALHTETTKVQVGPAVQVLLDFSQHGQRAELRLRYRRDLPAGLIPDPSKMALASFDEEFHAALVSAWQLAGEKLTHAVFWSVADSAGPVNRIVGPSLGAAFTVLLNEHARLSRRIRGPLTVRRLQPANAIVGAVNAKQPTKILGVKGYAQKLSVVTDKMRVVLPRSDIEEALAATSGVAELHPVDNWPEAAKKARGWARRRVLTIFSAVVLVIASAAATVASTIFVPRLMDSVAGDLLATAGEQRGKDEATSLVLTAAAQSASTRPDTVRALLAAELDNHGSTAILPTSTPAAELGLAADGKRVVVLEQDQRMVVWNVGSSPPTVVAVEGGISAVAVSQAGDQVVTGDRRGRIQLHDAASWAVLTAWDGPESTDATAREVKALSFDATGQRIAAAATNSGRVRLWEIATGKSRDRVLQDTYVTVDRMGFTADGVLITEGLGTYFGWLAWDPAKDTVREIRHDDSLPLYDNESMLFGPRTVLARCDGLKLSLLEPVTRQPVPQFSMGMPCGTHRVSLAGMRLLQVEVPVDSRLKPQQPKLLVSDGSAYWTSVPGRERPTPPGLTTAPVGGPYALSATANVLASYDSLSVRVTRLPEHKQGGANVRFAQFIGDGSLLALREDGELNQFDTDGDVVATQRLPFRTTATFNVAPDGSRLAVAGMDDRDSGYKIRRFTLPDLEPVGTEIVVPGAGLEDNRDIDVTTLDDGRLVVRTGRRLVVYPLQADTGQPQVINLSGASETLRMIVSARPGTHQVALPTPDGSGMQLIDVDTKQIGTAYGPFPGGLTEGILFDGPDTAVVLTSTSAINLDLSTGTVERPEGRPILSELSRDSASGAQVLHGWPTVLKKWGFAEDSQRIWDDTPVDAQWAKPRKVVLSSDGSQMAVVRDDLIDIVPTDPSEWQSSVCAMTSAAHDRARTHMAAPWLLDPC